MQFLEWLRRRFEPSLPVRRAQLCAVHYTGDKILVAAVHRDRRGMSPIGYPVFMLDCDATPGEVGGAVLSALAGSRDGVDPPEGVRMASAAVAVAGEKRLEDLEKRWEMINVTLDSERNVLIVHPMHRSAPGGWVRFTGDPEYCCEKDAQAVGKTLLSIMAEPPPRLVRRDPSHT